MTLQTLTFEHWLLAVAAVGLSMLGGFTILVLALDGLRWYRIRHNRIMRNDGNYSDF